MYGIRDIPVVREVPRVLWDVVEGTGKGFTQAGLYIADEASSIKNLIDKDKERDMEEYTITDNIKKDSVLGKIKDWSNYDWDTNPFKSKEYQTAGITTAASLMPALAGEAGALGTVGAAGTRAGKLAFTGLGVKNVIQDPSEKNIAALGLMATPLAMRTGKNIYVKAGAKEIAPESVFGEVTSRNIAEILNKFKKAKDINTGEYQGVHTTSKNFNKFENMEGLRKAGRVEDMGTYMADWGSGNKNWLNVGGYKRGFSLNPFKNIGNKPNVLKIRFDKISELPQDVIANANKLYSSKGRAAAYDYVNEWYAANAEVGTGYIPYRSVRWETPETQAVLPFKNEVALIRNGNWLQRIKGYKEYVKVGDTNVPVKVFKPTAGKSVDIVGGKSGITRGIKVSDLNTKYTNVLSDSGYNPTSYVTPQQVLSPGGVLYKNTREIYDPYSGYNTKASALTSGSSVYYDANTNSYYQIAKDNGRKYNYLRDNGDTNYGTYGYNEEIPQQYTYNYDTNRKGYGKGGIGGYDYKGNYNNYPNPTGYGKGRVPLYKMTPLALRKGREAVMTSRHQKTAWQPIMFDNNGRYIEGDYFETYNGAVSEGMIATDELPEKSFSVRPVKVPESLIKKARNAKNQYKFALRNGVYRERNKFTRDRPRESNFNWMGYLRASPQSY